MGTLTAYLRAAMKHATYELLPDQEGFYAEIDQCPGVLANADTLEDCRDELAEVLEGWVILGLRLGHTLPVIDGIDLAFKLEAA